MVLFLALWPLDSLFVFLGFIFPGWLPCRFSFTFDNLLFSQEVPGGKDAFIRREIMAFEGVQFIYSFLGYF